MVLLIGLGGIAGAFARFYMGKWISALIPGVFPAGTMLINLTGSFIMGLMIGLYDQRFIVDWVWFLFGVGFCGAYTTFSTFGYETIQLMDKKKSAAAASYVILSVLFGLLAAWLGMLLAAAM